MKNFLIPVSIFILLLSFSIVAAEVDVNTVVLPEPDKTGTALLNATLAARRSDLTFSQTPVTLEELSNLLWAAQGISDAEGHRTAPSAMASYPLQIWIVSTNIEGLEKALYAYHPAENTLEIVQWTETEAVLKYVPRNKVSDDYIDAAGVFIIGADMSVAETIGGEASIYLEAGHVMQNFLLEAAALGINARPQTGFDKEIYDWLISDPDGRKTIYRAPFGK